MKQPIGWALTLVAGFVMAACDSSQGLFSRHQKTERSEQTERTTAKPDRNLEKQPEATDERQAKIESWREDLRQKSQKVEETLQDKSRQIKAAIEGTGREAKAKTSDQGDNVKEELADRESKADRSGSDTSDEVLSEPRIRQRLGLTSESRSQDPQQDRPQSLDRRNSDEEMPNNDAGNPSRRESNSDSYSSDRRYRDDQRTNDNRLSESMDSQTSDRSERDQNPPESYRNREPRRYSDENTNQDRYTSRENRSRSSQQSNTDRAELNRSSRSGNDQRNSTRNNAADRLDRSGPDQDRRSDEDNSDRYGSERRQLADRIGEQVDALEQQLDRLNPTGRSSTTKVRSPRPGRELEKQRDELIKAYYQVQRGPDQNWKQTKRQADRLIYDTEEKLEQLDEKTNP